MARNYSEEVIRYEYFRKPQFAQEKVIEKNGAAYRNRTDT
jgi:hypothetical protein